MNCYDRNNNFGHDICDVTEPSNLYKDINLTFPAPSVTEAHLKGYLRYLFKDIGSGRAMYELQFLNHVKYYVKGKIIYNCN